MTGDNIDIAPAGDTLVDDLAALATESRAAGIKNVTVLGDRWVAGTERFDRSGEMLLLARSSGLVVGVGGITQCSDVPGALRVRRFYVGAAHRRRGVARLLAEPLIAHGLQHTATLTCNARASDSAPRFWEAMGFRPVDVPGITHRLDGN